MRTSFKTLAAFCSLAIMMNTGCADGAQNGSSETSVTPLLDKTQNGSTIVPESTDGDSSAAEKATCTVKFSANGATVKGSGAKASGTTLTISSAGVYEITGECEGGKIIVDAGEEDEVTLLLNGVQLTCDEGSAVFGKKAKKLVITAAEGSTNSLSDSENYVFEEGADEPDAAVFSKCDLVLNGSGALTVNGNYKAGIRSKDGLKICGGNITVNSADDGIKGKDYLIISDGNITVESGGDALKSTNAEDNTLGYINIRGGEISITSAQDAIQAETELIIDGGSISAVTGGGSATVEYKNEEVGWGGGKFSFGGNGFDFDSLSSDEGESAVSAKGLKAGTAIKISGGEFEIDSADDTVHSGGTITVGGGKFKLSSGDDGFHADDNLTINDGTINIVTSYEGIEGKSIDINGGTIDLYAFDDGFNAAGGDNGAMLGFGASSDHYLSISGGNITVNADGDGLDSNGIVAMSGGMVVVFGPTNSGNGALDFDSSFAVSGGTLIALGSAGMAQAPTTLSQPCISVLSEVAAGSTVEVRDSEDNVVLSVETPKECQSLIFTSDKLVADAEYTVYAAGTAVETVTATDGVTGSGANGGGGFGGGGHGGKPPRDMGGNGAAPEMPEEGMTPPEGFDPENPPEGFDPANIAGERPNDFGGRGNRQQITDGATPDSESTVENAIA